MQTVFDSLFIRPDTRDERINPIEIMDPVINLTDIFLKKTIEQQRSEFPLDPILSEKLIITDVLGGLWNENKNGVDGWIGYDSIPIEIKTQTYNENSTTKKGAYLLRGRGKFSGSSKAIHDDKLLRNEVVSFVGLSSSGDLYYIMSCLFSDISKYYLEKLEILKTKDYTNIDVNFGHIKDMPSFSINYLHPEIKNMFYNPRTQKQQFTKNFFDFIKNKKVTVPPQEMPEYYRKLRNQNKD